MSNIDYDIDSLLNVGQSEFHPISWPGADSGGTPGQGELNSNVKQYADYTG